MTKLKVDVLECSHEIAKRGGFLRRFLSKAFSFVEYHEKWKTNILFRSNKPIDKGSAIMFSNGEVFCVSESVRDIYCAGLREHTRDGTHHSFRSQPSAVPLGPREVIVFKTVSKNEQHLPRVMR